MLKPACLLLQALEVEYDSTNGVCTSKTDLGAKLRPHVNTNLITK